jgi:hypothetical protein
MGISVLADEKNVAKKSMIMLDRMIGCPKINFTPSPIEVRLTLAFFIVTCCDTAPIRTSARITAR